MVATISSSTYSWIVGDREKRLLHQGKVIYQVFKAARAINENVLCEMPIPTTIKEALPKSGKASLGEELYKILTAESISAEEMINSLNLKSEHSALEAINRLEAAIFARKEKITEQGNGKSPVRTSWSFIKDPISELDKRESLLHKAELLLLQLKTKYPNLPQTFLDVTKIQYGKASNETSRVLYILLSTLFEVWWLDYKNISTISSNDMTLPADLLKF